MLLHLVRHGPSAVDEFAPPHEWGLSPSAPDAVQALHDAGVLPMDALWFTSPEPKALATAMLLHPLGAALLDGLREAERGVGWLADGEFEAAVRRSFDSQDEPGAATWEPLSVTRERVAATAKSALSQAAASGESDVVLVGHGTAWTLLVAELTGLPADLDSWGRLTMPDYCCLDVDAATAMLRSSWGGWRAAT